MSCTDCKGGTPASWWKRCVECAMKRLRLIMSGGVTIESPAARRYSRKAPVDVIPRGETEWVPGVVVRFRLDSYTVDLERGGRTYASAATLRPRQDSSEPRNESAVELVADAPVAFGEFAAAGPGWKVG